MVMMYLDKEHGIRLESSILVENDPKLHRPGSEHVLTWVLWLMTVSWKLLFSQTVSPSQGRYKWAENQHTIYTIQSPIYSSLCRAMHPLVLWFFSHDQYNWYPARLQQGHLFCIIWCPSWGRVCCLSSDIHSSFLSKSGAQPSKFPAPLLRRSDQGTRFLSIRHEQGCSGCGRRLFSLFPLLPDGGC